MATAKVACLPPSSSASTSNVELSQYKSLSGSMTMVGENLLVTGNRGSLKGVDLPSNHCVFKASSSLNPRGTDKGLDKGLGCGADNSKTGANSEALNLLGPLGLFWHQPLSVWRTPNSFMFPSLLHPMQHKLKLYGFSTNNQLVFPQSLHEEPGGSEKDLSSSDCLHDTVARNSVTDCGNCGLNCFQATIGSTPFPSPLKCTQEATCTTHVSTNDDITGQSHGDDETQECIHTGTNNIHASSEFLHSGCQTESNPKHDSNLTELDGESSGAQLVVKSSQLQLKKLLSDESGFYDGTSCDAPCEWSRGICDHGDDEDESGDGSDYEDWDEDQQPGELDESADSLWKSFECCMLSPETLHIPTRAKTKSEPTSPLVRPSTLVQSCNEMMQLTQSAAKEHDSDKLVNKARQDATHVNRHIRRSADKEDESASDIHHMPIVACQVYVHPPNEESTAHSPHSPPAQQKRGTSTQLNKESTPLSASPSPRKQVRFPSDSSIAVVHEMVAWNFAYRAARKGQWEEYARNRAHFLRRIDKLASILEPCIAKKLAKFS